MRIDSARLESLASAILECGGTPPAHAKCVASHLVESNQTGHASHGVMRLSQYCTAIEQAEVVPQARPQVLRESIASTLIDGRRSFGQVAVAEAMALTIERARVAGVGSASLFNCYHSGRLGAYVHTAAQEGLVAIAMVNAGGGGQSVVPHGGVERRLATNPFAIAVPAKGEFIPVLDIATSVAPEGKIRDYLRRGAKLPPGWIVDALGIPSSDPSNFYGPPQGALLPWGGAIGYKGFGLAFMIDLLAGALSGAGVCGPDQPPPRDGVLLVALDVDHFSGLSYFTDQVERLIDHVKSCPPAQGYDEVYVPGELEHREMQRTKRLGVQVDDATWSELTSLARRLRVAPRLVDELESMTAKGRLVEPLPAPDVAAS